MTFTRVVVNNHSPQDPWSKAIGDINGDGQLDLIVSGAYGPVVWYRSPTWTPYTINDNAKTECGIAVGDINANGLLDVLIGDSWFENPGNPTTSGQWTRHTAFRNNHDMIIAYLDGDAKPDVIARSETGSAVFIYKQNSPTSWTEKIVDPEVGLNGLAVADIDRDGHPDIVVGGRWLGNPGDIIAGTWQTYSFSSWDNYADIAIADFNGDNWPDIALSVSESNGPIAWFENPGNPTTYDNWTQHTIETENLDRVHTIDVADFNLDGDNDIVASEFQGQGRLFIYLNQGNGLAWIRQQLGSDSIHNGVIGDIGNDGDVDIFGANAWGSTPILLYRNNIFTGPTSPTRVLVFSRTLGFRHASIPAGIAAIKSIGATHNFIVEATEDANAFTSSNLSFFAAVVFLNTTGDVLNTNQQAAFENFIRAGHGFVGIHSAADTEYDWLWYGHLLGAYFDSEPTNNGGMRLKVIDRNHPSISWFIPDTWTWLWTSEDVYNFQPNPKDNSVTVLLNLDESSVIGGNMSNDHPWAWYHEFDGGRAWYSTGGGATSAFTDDGLYLKHLAGGIEYAIGPRSSSPRIPTNDFYLPLLIRN